MSNPFWDFSLRSYRDSEVAAACIRLQDNAGLDVNMLLYAAWVAAAQERLARGHARELEELISPWRERVVQPLRNLRRQWQGYPAAADLRVQAQQLELAAERRQQDMMLAFYRQAPPLDAASRPLVDNLAVVANLMSPDSSSWRADLAQLASQLGSLQGLA